MRKITLIIMCLLALVFFVQGCSKPVSSVRTVVGTWKTQQTITPYFYEKFLPKGTEIEIKPFTNPGDQKTALLAGTLDMTGTTMVQAIMCAANDEPVKLVCVLSNKCSALVVGNNSKIENTADLKGKRIGYVPNTMHHILLLEVLAEAGVDVSDVKLIRVDFFDMETALAAGQIDAFLSGEPYPTQAVANGVGRILSYPYMDSIGTINSGMLVTEKMIQQDPKKVQMLVTAHVKATKYLLDNPSDWIEASVKFGAKPEILEKAAENIQMGYKMDAEFIDNLNNLALKMKELGMIDTVPDLSKLVDTSFLNTAEKSLGIK